MPDPTVNAEDLPAFSLFNLGSLVGLDGNNEGVLYPLKGIISGSTRPSAVLSSSTNILATHEGAFVTVDSGTAVTITIPPEVTLTFPLRARIQLFRAGTGTVTVVAGSGVTLRSCGRPKLRVQGSIAELIKVAADEWALTGDTAA